GGTDGLEQIDPALIGDDNVIWSFHSYDPYLFTHQAATWTDGPNAFFADVPYPPDRIDDALAAKLVAEATARATEAGSAFDEAALTEAMRTYRAQGVEIVAREPKNAAAWADRHGIPRNRLILGEFGTMREDAQGRRFQGLGREAFLLDKRRAAEELGIGWAVWVWSGTFGIAEDDATRVFSPATCEGLGLSGC
ncbi:cellulase family glycosylhydrolase, partial [Tabrizicola sp.]|uniref:cellulase family glycosylhydrolase n=1 Tax=Tabrizicola sp. TaxID=2005166 RepID=UPI003F32C063